LPTTGTRVSSNSGRGAAAPDSRMEELMHDA
jgi:hypothetical protein